MSPLSRREILRKGTVIPPLVGSGGCLSSGEGNPTESTTRTSTPSSHRTESSAPTETDSDNSASTAVTPDPSDPIQLDCYNETDEEQTARYSIIRGSTSISEGDVHVPASGFASTELDIKRRGAYELTLSVKNIDAGTFPFDIGEYELRTGSNLVVWIYEEEIEMGIEE